MNSPELDSQYPNAIIATDEQIDQLTEVVRSKSKIVAFTGAGVSTESGIPDYRGPNGVWARNAIPHVDTIRTDDEARKEMWAYRREHYPEMMTKQPNMGHLALTQLDRLGKLLAIVTQNIDGLHQKALTNPDRIVELHGSTHKLRCLNCGRVYDGADIQARLEQGEEDPHCEVCGGQLRTATILFGEALPPVALQTAVAVSRAADLMLVIGSSLVVNPAARLPQIAKDNGADVIIVNREPTPLDRIADLRILADAGSTLARCVDLVSASPE